MTILIKNNQKFLLFKKTKRKIYEILIHEFIRKLFGHSYSSQETNIISPALNNGTYPYG
jgi:hypothetical protein